MPEKKKNVVPHLRFPEFRDAGEWVVKNFYDLLEDVLDFRGRTPKKLGMDWGGGNIVSLSANNVKNGYIDYGAECKLGSEALYEKWMGKVSLEKGDIVFTTEAPLGNALLVPDSQKYILSQRVVAFKIKKEIDNAFIVQLIWSSQFQNKLKMLSTGSTAKGINQKTLKKVRVKIPKKKVEQQKIADCLSSLDEVIDLEAQKLDALKAHKKGLMQQLFPREGETIPRLRFPEFRDAEEWEVKRLGEVCELNPPSAQLPASFIYIDLESVESGRLLQKKRIEKRNAPSRAQRVLKKGDILYQMVRPYQKNNFLFNIDNFNDYVASTGYAQLRAYNSEGFLFQLIHTDDFVDKVLAKCTGSNYPAINSSDLAVIYVAIPYPEEQQKIADGLASLDEVINLQTQKLDALKAHKKGLMQQLFPQEVD